jgi:hypothetical protein
MDRLLDNMLIPGEPVSSEQAHHKNLICKSSVVELTFKVRGGASLQDKKHTSERKGRPALKGKGHEPR